MAGRWRASRSNGVDVGSQLIREGHALPQPPPRTFERWPNLEARIGTGRAVRPCRGGVITTKYCRSFSTESAKSKRTGEA
jgi:hypothetical protein